MKTYLRLLQFARPVKKYATPYFFYTLLHAFFNMVMYMGIAPILQSLFTPEGGMKLVTRMPAFGVSSEYISDLVHYLVYRTFGEGFRMTDLLIFLCLFTIVVILLSNLFRYLSSRTIEGLRIHTMQNLRNSVFSNVMHLHAGYFNNERKGDILSKITADVQIVQFAVTNTLQVAFREPFMMAGFLYILISTSLDLTLFTVLVLPLMAVVIWYVIKNLRRSAKAAQEALADMVTTTDEALGGIKIIKSYNATDYIVRKFLGQNARYSRIAKSIANRQTLASPMSEFLGISAVAVVLVYGGGLVMEGELAPEKFLMYLVAFSQLVRPVKTFVDSFSTIHQGLAAGERVLGLIDTRSQITDAPDAVEMTGFERSIEFRNVTFSYQNREVLKDVSFTIEKGETVALVGPSGGGKSTISDLIPRFYDPQRGAVLIDGKDIRGYELESLRSHMGIVAQDTVLFNDTIENNIRLGKQDATYEEVVQAARVANADPFIRETEQGYASNVGDRGVKLSGGQRQRLSIARAVLKNPEILILDEATSALDTESEKLVQDALNKLLKGRTSLVIAHRLSTISNAHKIIVVDQGRIVETGTHADLMARGGMYRRLIDMQQIGLPEGKME